MCVAMVDWLFLNVKYIYSILTTNMMCLAMGYWILLQNLQKFKYFCILLQNCYFLIIFMKKVGNILASDYGTLISPTTRNNNNCWWCWTVLFQIVELQRVRLLSLLMIFDGFELYFIQLWWILSYTVFLETISSDIELCMDIHT